MTQCWEEVEQIMGARAATEDAWTAAKQIIGERRVTLGPVASHSWLHQPEHLAFQLARYRAAAALIGCAETVLEMGCGEGIGAGILARGRYYLGIDTDHDAIKVAQGDSPISCEFDCDDIFNVGGWNFEAVALLDVIEHIPAEREDELMRAIVAAMPNAPHGVCVIGTPNQAFNHLASPQSRAGHVNLYSHDRLLALMRRYFHVVQSFGMNDVALHFGHPEARHYLLMCGIGPRRGV